MFVINRLKIVIKTSGCNFGLDKQFSKGVNLIVSNKNTAGKSSCIEAIYYCLGLEEIVGGKNEKILKPVFKSKIDCNGKEYVPIETEMFLEISNAYKVITINRNVEKISKHNSIIRVFQGNMEDTLKGKCNSEEFYIHTNGSATSDRGFHKFLEEFIGLNLPQVTNYEEKETKLYLQTLFPAMFIEQKRGWSGLLATIPNFGIRDVKRKVIEYILNLDTIENEKLKSQYKLIENKIKDNWAKLFHEIEFCLVENGCTMPNLPLKPQCLTRDNLKMLGIFKEDDCEIINIEEYIENLKNKSKKLGQKELKVGCNIDELQKKLEDIKLDIQQDEEILDAQVQKINLEEAEIKTIKNNLEIINSDLHTNNDLKRLKTLGALEGTSIVNDVCPTCKQKIQDCLLPQDKLCKVMSIEENIEHLKEQKHLLEYTMNAYKDNINKSKKLIETIKTKIYNKRRMARTIVNDIYSTDESLTEAFVYEKVMIDEEIEKLYKLIRNIDDYKEKLLELSNDFVKLQQNKKELPKDSFSEADKVKIKKLETEFIKRLEKYGYSSIQNLSEIEISKEKLLPTVYGFDVTSDCSASDNIRVIWSFTISLLINSLLYDGNHPNTLIIDEPAQQSVVNSDLFVFLKDLCELNNQSQIIVGVTLNSDETREFAKGLSNVNMLLIEGKAIKPL